MRDNGYIPSIVQHETECYICHRQGALHRHEPLDGIGRRSKSKALGLWVYMCPYHHKAAHRDREMQDMLRADCQRAAMREYGWNTEDFIREFNRSYL